VLIAAGFLAFSGYLDATTVIVVSTLASVVLSGQPYALAAAIFSGQP
jgi:membrane protein DedA with SNARE-associated domain